MRTELPVDRLHRRLGADPGPEPDPVVDPAGADPGETRAGAGPDPGASAAPETALSRWLPDVPAGQPTGLVAAIRADPGRSGAVALAAVGVIAVLVTIFTLLRDDTPPVRSAQLPPVEMVSSAGDASGPAEPPAADQPVVVSVVGLVHKPGVVKLAPGARIADALTAAGGAVNGADLIGLNMARRVADGEQIIVGIATAAGDASAMGSSVSSGAPATAAGPSATATGAAPAGSTAAPDASVNLNTATVDELDTLPGVGPVTAAAIVAWRDSNGQFGSVDQLAEVDGIGPARLDKLRDRVHV